LISRFQFPLTNPHYRSSTNSSLNKKTVRSDKIVWWDGSILLCYKIGQKIYFFLKPHFEMCLHLGKNSDKKDLKVEKFPLFLLSLNRNYSTCEQILGFLVLKTFEK